MKQGPAHPLVQYHLSQADDPDQKVAALAEKLLVLAKEHSRIPQAIHVPPPALEEVKEHLLERFAGP